MASSALWKEIAAWLAFALLALFFLVLKSFSFHWQVGDENVYFYMAWATVDHGALPYADYFFAHPPLHLLPGVLVFGLLGFSQFTVRLIPIGSTLVGAVFLFLLARRRVGRFGAVAVVFLYLTAFSLIRASTHWTGINLSVMWICAGLWAVFGRRYILAGVFFALGVCTGSYVLPGAIMAGMLVFLGSNKSGLRYVLGFAIPWFAVQLVAVIIGGGDYLQAVYGYHVLKPVAEGASFRMSVRVFTDNFTLFLGALAGPLMAWLEGRLAGETSPGEDQYQDDPPQGSAWARFWGWWRRRLLSGQAKDVARVGALWALGYVIFIALLPRVFPFYFLLMFPGMALAGAYAVDRWFTHAVKLTTGFKRRTKTWYESVSVLGLIILATGVAYVIRAPLQHSLLPNYVRKHDKRMKWSDGSMPGFVNRLMRTCCWGDVAEAYTDYGTIREILYHESRYFEKAGELANLVRENSHVDQTLFGDSSTAGLVALLSGRRLAADFCDTNTMRFRSGVTTVQEALEKIDTPELVFVLAGARVKRSRNGKRVVHLRRFASVPGFKRWLKEDFELAHRVADRTKGWFFLLRRKPQ